MSQSDPSLYHTPKTLRSLSDLVEAGLIDDVQAQALIPVAERYSTAIPPLMQSLINPDGKADPIARQFVPSPLELEQTADERPDPIGDEVKSPLPGLVHRYPDRVLLKPLLVCPVYCRFCFRRESVGDAKATLTDAQMAQALDYIAHAPQVREVILTGGDPLMLTAERIKTLHAALIKIPHLEVIRWHSRVPIVTPERITPQVAQALAMPFDHGKAVWVSIHTNHPDELTPQASQAIATLRRAGLALVAQTVLLKGVNDQTTILEALFRALIRLGVKPYYLHHPDLAPGTRHFRLTIAQGQALVKSLRGRLSGIAQPTYVLDIPGGEGKAPLMDSYWDQDASLIEDWQGKRHTYET